MINQNLYFLQTAISIITRAQSLYKSPFELAERDREFLIEKTNQAKLALSMEKYDLPIFNICHDPERKISTEVEKFVRHDSYILRLALLVFSIRVFINTGTVAQTFYWFDNEKTVQLVERMDDAQTIDAIITGKIYFKPIRPFADLVDCDFSTVIGAPNPTLELTGYLQSRYSHWSN